MNKFVSILIGFLIIVGCNSSKNITNPAPFISLRTWADVTNKFGSPDKVKYKGSMQAWQYCIAKTGENYIVVVFDKDTVRSLSKYSKRSRSTQTTINAPLDCWSFYNIDPFRNL